MKKIGWVVAAGVLLACGKGAVTSNYKEPVAVLEGRIASAAKTPDTYTRAATVWTLAPENVTASAENVAVDLGPVGDIGVVFKLAITALPPASALANCGETAKAASVVCLCSTCKERRRQVSFTTTSSRRRADSPGCKST